MTISYGTSPGSPFLLSVFFRLMPNEHNNPGVAELKVGQYVTSLLEEVKNDGRVVRLSISPTAVAQAVADTEHGWTLTNLLPGLVVKAQIKKVH